MILVIDDDAHALKLVDLQLTRAGFKVITAASGDAGIEMARTGHPHLILLDIFMPGKDGFDVLKSLQMQKDTAHIPVIMLSAQKEKDAVVNAMKMGVADYIIKPYDNIALVEKIKCAIAYHAMHRIKTETGASTVRIMKGAGRTIIVIDTLLRDPQLTAEIQQIFTQTFIADASGDLLVFDLRSVPSMDKNDIAVLKNLISFFSGRAVYVIAGLHYRIIASDSSISFDKSFKLYISPGDMELELQNRYGS